MKDLTLEEKWERIKPFYTRAGKIAFKDPYFRFKSRPSDENIEFLVQKLRALKEDYYKFYEKHPALLEILTRDTVIIKTNQDVCLSSRGVVKEIVICRE